VRMGEQGKCRAEYSGTGMWKTEGESALALGVMAAQRRRVLGSVGGEHRLGPTENQVTVRMEGGSQSKRPSGGIRGSYRGGLEAGGCGSGEMDGGWQSGSEPVDLRGERESFGWQIGSWGTEEGEGGSAVQVGAHSKG